MTDAEELTGVPNEEIIGVPDTETEEAAPNQNLYQRYGTRSIRYSMRNWYPIFFNLSWLRVRMSYHVFNNLAELFNGDLAAKIGRGIFSKDLMDRECNCYLPSKVNRNVSTNHILNFPPWISHMKP